MRKVFFQEIPIKPIADSQNAVFAAIMQSIAQNPREIPAYERLANQKVYDWYGLSKVEIAEIEAADSLWKSGK